MQHALQDGGKLVVREGQAAVVIAEGKLSDVFGPSTSAVQPHSRRLSTRKWAWVRRPLPTAAPIFHYNRPDGQTVQVAAAEVPDVARAMAAPLPLPLPAG